MNADVQPEHTPGFRRRFLITPSPGQVRSEVEDDYHCMGVTLQHDGVTARSVKAEMMRAPWTTCPGALGHCENTFTGIALDAFATRAPAKSTNCTHLFDLALLAAAHALDEDVLTYDILVSDPVDGRRVAELRRNGVPVLGWTDSSFRIIEPAELAGVKLFDMRSWIDSLDSRRQEEARLLRWGSVIAHGRNIPLEKQSDASRMPPNCYTFQPEQAVRARRVGAIRDFSDGTIQPLENVGRAQ